MNNHYHQRELEATLKHAAAQFPAIVLTGPRQSGKTTLLRHLFGNTHNYVTLDDPQVRQTALNDPKLFLEKYPAPVIIDEIQYAPTLLPYLKMMIDQERSKKGQFILTGSQQFPMMQGVTESLAGRTAVLTLLPMSWREIISGVEAEKLTGQRLAVGWLRGSFPELVVNPEADNQLWYAGYLQTYLERDVRSLRQIGDLGEFQNFLQALAARNGQMLKLSEISRDLGVAVNTVKAWIRILEASQQIYLLRPYHRNFGKRLIKSPKLYFIDMGLLCYLSGLKDPAHALQGPAAGALMETAICGELLRNFSNQGKVPRLYFWRTSQGEEVDFIVETPEGLVALEGKLTSTPRISLADTLVKLSEMFSADFQNGYLVCLTEQMTALTKNVAAVPFAWLVQQRF